MKTTSIRRMKVIVTIMAVSAAPSFAQGTFQAAVGGNLNDEARAVKQTTDGGYVAAGYTKSFGSGGSDMMLVKLSPAGFMEWANSFGGNQGDDAYAVEQTADGGYIMAGTTQSYGEGNEDVYILKTNSEGVTEWSRTVGGPAADEARSIRQTSDGGYIIAGYTKSYGPSNDNVYLIRLDANGDLEWAAVFGGNSIDRGHSVRQSPDGGYILAGYTNSDGSGASDIYLIKTDPGGNVEWHKIIGNISNDMAFDVAVTKDSAYAVTGISTYFAPGSSVEVFLMKVDASGIILWTKAYGSIGGSSDEQGYALLQTADNGFAIAGRTLTGGAFSYDMFLLRTDPDGELLWVSSFGTAGTEEGYAVMETWDAGFILAGKTFGFGSGANDWYLVKTDSAGNCFCYQNPVSPLVTMVIPDEDTGITIDAGGVQTVPVSPETAAPAVYTSICNTLPLELLSFTAGDEGLSVNLDWVTAGESGVRHFEAQRSADGVSFEALGTVQATGDAIYTFRDNNPGCGERYYRLKIADLDGSFTYSGLAVAHGNLCGGEMLVFPNPAMAGDEIRIVFPGHASDEIYLALHDYRGVKILEAPNTASALIIRPGTVTPGIYWITARTGNGVYRSRVVFN